MGIKLIKRFLTPFAPLKPEPYKLTLSWGTAMESSTGERFRRDRVEPAILQVRSVTKPIEDQYTKAQKRNKLTAALQLALWNNGFFKGLKDRRGRTVTYETAVDGLSGRMTNAAILAAKDAGYIINKDGSLTRMSDLTGDMVKNAKGPETEVKSAEIPSSEVLPQQASAGIFSRVTNSENGRRLASNLLRNPVLGTIDAVGYAADRLGVPSNVTNFVRDLNVSVPQRLVAAPLAGIKTLFNDKSYSDNYHEELSNPNFFTRTFMIKPLINRNNNFSEELLQVMRDMAQKKGYITDADIHRESVDGRYGKFDDSISDYLSHPTKVVQTALGRTHRRNGVMYDLFDVNVQSEQALKDNQLYLDKMKEQGGANYGSLRAIMPYISSVDIMPDEYKVNTLIKL